MNVGGFQFCMFFSVLIHTAQIKHADGKQHQPCSMQNRTSAPNENIKSMDGGSQTKKCIIRVLLVLGVQAEYPWAGLSLVLHG